MESELLELSYLIKFGRQTEVLDELVVFSVEDAESVIACEEHLMAFEMLGYEWAQVLDENGKISRYYRWQKGKFVRDINLELALNPRPSKNTFKEYEISATGESGGQVLKVKVSSDKLASAMKQARNISKAFLEFRNSGQVQDFQYEGLEDEEDEEDQLPSLDARPRLKNSAHEILRQARNHFKKENYTQALELFEASLPDCQENLSDNLSAAKAAVEARRYPLAEKWANKVLQRQPNNSDALIIKGQIYTYWQSFDQAVSYWEKALEKDPNNPLVKKCYQEAKARFMRKGERSVSDDEVFQENRTHEEGDEQRTWVRRTCSLPIFVKGENMTQGSKFTMKSLSAGGALVECEKASSFPKRFQFFISFPNFRSVLGIGEKVYSTASQQVGIKFCFLSPEDREFINEQVLSYPK